MKQSTRRCRTLMAVQVLFPAVKDIENTCPGSFGWEEGLEVALYVTAGNFHLAECQPGCLPLVDHSCYNTTATSMANKVSQKQPNVVMGNVNWIPLCTIILFWQFDNSLGWSSLSRRESTTKERPSFICNLDLFHCRQTLVASTIWWWLTLLPLSSSAIELQQQQLQCPETFASQPLGIQNIVGIRPSSVQQSSPTSPSSLSAKPSSPKTSSTTSKSKRSVSSSPLCTESSSESINGNVNNEYSIHGLIYMPNQQTTNLVEMTNDQLIITVSAVDDPSATILAGANIPMSQIKSFPISFSLSKANLLLKVPNQQQLQRQQGMDSTSTDATTSSSISSEERLWDQSVLYAPKDLYVSAKICSTTSSSSSSSTFCSDATTVKYQGRGYSKLLLLPTGGGGDSSNAGSNDSVDDDDFKVVRAAASIRLGRSTVPDTLGTW